MIPLKIKLCLRFFIVVKNKALVKAWSWGSPVQGTALRKLCLIIRAIDTSEHEDSV